MSRILIKTLATQFYRINSGLFLTVFLLLFGIVNGKDCLNMHYAIMQEIVNNSVAAIVAIFITTLYTLKCIQFSKQQITHPRNRFLLELRTLTNNQLLQLSLAVAGIMLAPFIVYGLTASIVSFAHAHYTSACLIVLILGIFTWLLAKTISLSISHPDKQIYEAKSKGNTKHFSLFTIMLRFSLHNAKGKLIGLKVVAILLLQAMIMANSERMSREAICVLMMFIIAAHALLPFYYQRFIDTKLHFIRNLPFSPTKIYGMLIFSYAIILLPELLFLLANGYKEIGINTTISIYVFGIFQLACYSCMLMIKNVTLERYTAIVASFFFSSLLILAAGGLWPIACIEILFSLLLFQWLYTRYETSL